MTPAKPIRGLNAPMRALEQACAELGLDPADYRAARGEVCPTCEGLGWVGAVGFIGGFASIGKMAATGRLPTRPCPDCAGRQPERSEP